MKRIVLLTACLALVACASAMKIPPPELQLSQLVGPAELNWPGEGEIELQFALTVLNHANEPITLRQIQIESTGDGGPFAMPRAGYPLTKVIAPGAQEVIPFYAKAYAFSGRGRQLDAHAPVTVRAIAYFEAPSGNFRRTVITNLPQ